MAGKIGRKDKGVVNVQISQSPSFGCAKDPDCEAGVGGVFGEDWMRRLAEQTVEHQGRGVGEGVGRRNS